MRNNRTRRSRARHSVAAIMGTPAPQVNPLQELEAKFSRLAEVRRQLVAAKELHREHDRLVEELSSLFITPTTTGWDVKSQITLGTRIHHLNPSFFDAAEHRIKAKRWKSTAFETVTLD